MFGVPPRLTFRQFLLLVSPFFCPRGPRCSRHPLRLTLTAALRETRFPLPFFCVRWWVGKCSSPSRRRRFLREGPGLQRVKKVCRIPLFLFFFLHVHDCTLPSSFLSLLFWGSLHWIGFGVVLVLALRVPGSQSWSGFSGEGCPLLPRNPCGVPFDSEHCQFAFFYFVTCTFWPAI